MLIFRLKLAVVPLMQLLKFYCKSHWGEYKTKTEDLRPKNEDPVKIVLKSLKKGWNMILDQSRNKEHQDLLHQRI